MEIKSIGDFLNMDCTVREVSLITIEGPPGKTWLTISTQKALPLESIRKILQSDKNVRLPTSTELDRLRKWALTHGKVSDFTQDAYATYAIEESLRKKHSIVKGFKTGRVFLLREKSIYRVVFISDNSELWNF